VLAVYLAYSTAFVTYYKSRVIQCIMRLLTLLNNAIIFVDGKIILKFILK